MLWDRTYLIFFIMTPGTKSRNMIMVQSPHQYRVAHKRNWMTLKTA